MPVNRAAGEPFLFAGVGDVVDGDAIAWGALPMDAPARAELDALMETPRLSWVRSVAGAGAGVEMFVALTEAGYRAAPFLDLARVLLHARDSMLLYAAPADSLLQWRLPSPSPVGAIFHTGHCGSTLLSRAIDAATESLPLREPPALIRLAEARRLEQAGGAGGDPRLNAWVLASIERRFKPAQLPVVKATSLASNLAPAILGRHADSRAIYLYQDLDSHVLSLLRHANSDLVRGYDAAAVDLQHLVGEPVAQRGDGVAQRAALGWVGRMWSLLEADGAHPGRGRFVDCAELLARPAAALTDVIAHLGLSRVDGPLLPEAVWQRDAKRPDVAFSAEARRDGLAQRRRTHDGELRGARRHVEALLARHAVLQPLVRYAGA